MSGVERLWREDRKYLGQEMLFKPCLRRRVHAAFANHFYSGASQFAVDCVPGPLLRSEEHTSELQSLMRNSYAVFCLKKKTITKPISLTFHESICIQPNHTPNIL